MKYRSEIFFREIVLMLFMMVPVVSVASQTRSSDSTLINNKAVVVEFYKAVQSAELEGLSSFFAENYEIENVGTLKEF